jgi:hypothetical protein
VFGGVREERARFVMAVGSFAGGLGVHVHLWICAGGTFTPELFNLTSSPPSSSILRLHPSTPIASNHN